MNTSDDDAWIDGLAGRAHDQTPASSEGAHLRRALLALPSSNDQGQEAPSASVTREGQLLRRARRAGLRLAPTHALQRRRWFGLAAALALLAFGINWWPRTLDDSVAVRRAADSIARLEVADPQGAQRGLLAQLAAAGITGRGYEMLGRYGIDADLPQELTAAQLDLLSQYGITVPADRVLRVEFVMPPAP